MEGGYASVRDVTTMQLEDHQHSFFLAETWEPLPLLSSSCHLLYCFWHRLVTLEIIWMFSDMFFMFLQMQVPISSIWWFIFGQSEFYIHNWGSPPASIKWLAWKASGDLHPKKLDFCSGALLLIWLYSYKYNSSLIFSKYASWLSQKFLSTHLLLACHLILVAALQFLLLYSEMNCGIECVLTPVSKCGFFRVSTQGGKQGRRASAMSLQVCPATALNTWGQGNQQAESACHVRDARIDHRCSTDEECGVDSTTCRRRSCSMAGYCGLWLFIW